MTSNELKHKAKLKYFFALLGRYCFPYRNQHTRIATSQSAQTISAAFCICINSCEMKKPSMEYRNSHTMFSPNANSGGGTVAFALLSI